MKKSLIIVFALVLVSLTGFSRNPQNLYPVGNNINWNNPASWSASQGGPTCMLIPEGNDSIFITSNISLDTDFTLFNGGYLSINQNCSLTSTNNKLIVSGNGKIVCNGNLNILQIEAGNVAQIIIGTSGKVKLLNDFINNSTLITIDGLLEVGGMLQNNNQQGNPAITGKGTITSEIYSGSGTILGITNISLIPLQSSITECTWTGSHSIDWADPLNWSYSRLPNPEQKISILASRAFSPSIKSTIICKNLIVNAGASMIISAEGALTVSGDLSVADGAELRIKTGESTHGSLITLGKNSGNIIFEYNVIKNRQCDVSSPVSDAQSSVFLNMYLRAYDEPTASWGQYIIPTNVSMGVMEGYEVFSTYSDTREFIGQPNSGENQINVSASGDGWNFIGNPYTSALNWGSQTAPANGWSRNDVYGAIYYWDNTANGNKGNYAVYCPGGNGISANGGSSVILPSQGFFVKAIKSGIVKVTDKACVHALLGGNKPSETSTLRLTARGNSMWDETVLQFNNEATTGFDNDFDALKLSGNEEAPSMFTKLDDGTKVSINSLPTSSLDGDIPIGFSCGKAGTYTIEINGINSMSPDLPVYLIDTKNNSVINLRNDSSIVFDYNLNDDAMRFSLHFSSPYGINHVELENPKIYYSSGSINVELGNLYSNSSINVFDLTGRQVAGDSSAKEGLNKIPFDGSTGYYVIKISDKNNSYTTKLWVN
jgi:trimeric autotransporter adhesin